MKPERRYIMMLPQFTFMHKTKFLAGTNTLEQLPAELDQKECKRALIITDNRSVKKGALKVLAGAFSKYDTVLHVYDRITDDLQESQLEELAKVLVQTKSDSILAVGSISAIDAARLVNVRVSLGVSDLSRVQDTRDAVSEMKPLYVIPSIALGRTCMSVPNLIYGPRLQKNMMIFMPSAMILDKRMMKPESAEATAQCGITALFHAIEASIGPSANPVTQSFAFSALAILREHMIIAVKKASSKARHLHIAGASHLADAAFSNISFGLGVSLKNAVEGIAGEKAVPGAGFLLPALMRARIKTRKEDVERLLWPLRGPEIFAGTPENQRGEMAIEAVETLLAGLQKAGGIGDSPFIPGHPKGNDAQILESVINDRECLRVEGIEPEDVKTFWYHRLYVYMK